MSRRLKVLCVFDHFGSGGAQRQMVNLALGLKDRGHVVHMFAYYPAYRFFRPLVEGARIPIFEYRGKPGWWFRFGVLKALVGIRRAEKYDAVVAFLNAPSVYAELTQILNARCTLVVSERSSRLNDRSRAGSIVRRLLHLAATRVVTNSNAHRAWLVDNHPWLRAKTTVISNGLDLSLFTRRASAPARARDLRFIAVGRISKEKNLLTFIEGLRMFGDSHGWVPTVHWVGRREESTREGLAFCAEVDRRLVESPLVGQSWSWLGERNDIPALLAEYHALIHPSLYEGFPNAICESLAAGLPVLASDVCDNSRLVPDGERGFLFDPKSAEGIANAVKRLTALPPMEWQRMSGSARMFAEEDLSADQMAARYERLIAT